MTHEDVKEIYDRLRSTEAETRAQNERIAALSDRMDSMIARWDAQMTFMHRVVYILISALVSLALGPRIAEKVMAGGVQNTAGIRIDIAPWSGDRHGIVKKVLVA